MLGLGSAVAARPLPDLRLPSWDLEVELAVLLQQSPLAITSCDPLVEEVMVNWVWQRCCCRLGMRICGPLAEMPYPNYLEGFRWAIALHHAKPEEGTSL